MGFCHGDSSLVFEFAAEEGSLVFVGCWGRRKGRFESLGYCESFVFEVKHLFRFISSSWIVRCVRPGKVGSYEELKHLLDLGMICYF